MIVKQMQIFMLIIRLHKIHYNSGESIKVMIMIVKQMKTFMLVIRLDKLYYVYVCKIVQVSQIIFLDS